MYSHVIIVQLADLRSFIIFFDGFIPQHLRIDIKVVFYSGVCHAPATRTLHFAQNNDMMCFP